MNKRDNMLIQQKDVTDITDILNDTSNCTTGTTTQAYYCIEIREGCEIKSVLRPNEKFFKDDDKLKDENIVVNYHWCDSQYKWHGYIKVEKSQITAAKIKLHVERLNNNIVFKHVYCIGLLSDAGKSMKIIMKNLSDFKKMAGSTQSRRFKIVGRAPDCVKAVMKNDILTIPHRSHLNEINQIKPELSDLLREDGKIIVNQCPTISESDGNLEGYLVCLKEHTIFRIMQPLQTFLRQNGHDSLANAIQLTIVSQNSVIGEIRSHITDICASNWESYWRGQVEKKLLKDDDATVKIFLHKAKAELERLTLKHPNVTPQTEKCSKKHLEEKRASALFDQTVWDAIDKRRSGLIDRLEEHDILNTALSNVYQFHKGLETYAPSSYTEFDFSQAKATLLASIITTTNAISADVKCSKENTKAKKSKYAENLLPGYFYVRVCDNEDIIDAEHTKGYIKFGITKDLENRHKSYGKANNGKYACHVLFDKLSIAKSVEASFRQLFRHVTLNDTREYVSVENVILVYSLDQNYFPDDKACANFVLQKAKAIALSLTR